jgi:hydroxymethylpyrimidine/phosphomethylpyrimidine kinase
MIPRALSIAGSDSGGGAGIQQDLKTFQALGVWGMTAVTAVTVQNTTGVLSFVEIPPETVSAQIAAVAEDIGVDAAKTGMLPSAPIVEAVARSIRDASLDRLVVDPVVASTHGDALISADALAALAEVLLPLALIVTPNVHEAEALCGMEISDRAGQAEAARAVHALGPRAVLVTGGHLSGDAVDVLYDGERTVEIAGRRLEARNTHGGGCMLSAAIAAALAKGLDLETSVREAKAFVARGIANALALGKGLGPVNPSWGFEGERRGAAPEEGLA